ncbi:MAG: RGCVC family protein [Pseudonocardia sp.]|nr:RGCVC family protein [Pseudonocardia sp.]
MPTTELRFPRAEPSTADRTDFTCAVCPHEWAAHDPIGIRFCSATVAGRLHRGCACVSDTRSEVRR